jgi:hypothetical protein
MLGLDVKRYSAIPVTESPSSSSSSSSSISSTLHYPVIALVGSLFFGTIYFIVFHLATSVVVPAFIDTSANQTLSKMH